MIESTEYWSEFVDIVHDEICKLFFSGVSFLQCAVADICNPNDFCCTNQKTSAAVFLSPY